MCIDVKLLNKRLTGPDRALRNHTPHSKWCILGILRRFNILTHLISGLKREKHEVTYQVQKANEDQHLYVTLKTAQKNWNCLHCRGCAVRAHTQLCLHRSGTCLLSGRNPPPPGWRVHTSGAAQFLQRSGFPSVRQKLESLTSFSHSMTSRPRTGLALCLGHTQARHCRPYLQCGGKRATRFWSHSKSTLERLPLVCGPSAEDTATVPGTGESSRDI